MRVAVLVAIFSLVSACAKNDDPKTPGYWQDRLKERREREEALRQLGNLGDKVALEDVREWFNKPGEWQPDAAYALAQLGGAAVVPELLGGLQYNVSGAQDRETRDRHRTNQNIARALALLKSKEAVGPLVKFLTNGEDRTREVVIRSLATIGDPAATEPLLAIALEDKQPFLRKVAIEALGELRSPASIPALIKLLFAEVQGVGFYDVARFSLVQVGQPAIPDLVSTLSRKNSEVEAMRGADGKPLAEGTIEAKAAGVLGAMRAKEAEAALVAALETYLKKAQSAGPSAGLTPVVVELAYALGSLSTPNSVKALLGAARSTDPDTRIAAAEALTAAGDASSAAPLLATARTGSDLARNVALVAASRLGEGGMLAEFDSARKAAGEAGVAAEADRVRLVAAGECKADAACWRAKLKDADARVRDRAAFQLGWLGAKDATEELFAALDDNSVEVRFAALLSLERLGTSDVARLTALQSRFANKLEYQALSAELSRFIAVAKSKQPTGSTTTAAPTK